MKTKSFGILMFISILCSNMLFAQVQNLNRIGQTPGGASFHVNYDTVGKRLIVGCGTSVWIYNLSDPLHPHVLAKRPLLGMINETNVSGNVLFVAATHDGVYALDLLSDSLTVLAHYSVPTGFGDRAAYDLARINDTLYISDNAYIRRLRYDSITGFTALTSSGGLPSETRCIAQKGNYIALGIRELFTGRVTIYDKSNLNTAIASWQSNLITKIRDVRFSDLRNDIIYVCGGSSDAGFNSYFVSLQIIGNTLTPIDTFHIAGIPVLAAANFQNMDTRNDTLFVATGCAVDVAMGAPLSYIPVFDATDLPTDTMNMISHINAGLWHFDVALIHGTPYMATASEWLGVVINDVSTLAPIDTVKLIETGGWTQNCKVRGDTLWVAHEGWGLAAYNIDSLMFNQGYMTNSLILHLFASGSSHFFVGDFEFLNDSLLVLSSGDLYNIKPWQQGGQPDLLYKINGAGVMHNTLTGSGQRLVIGSEFFGLSQKMSLFNPYDPLGNSLRTINLFNNPQSICVVKDTVFYGMKTDSVSTTVYLSAAKIVNDDFIIIDTISMQGNSQINSISVENNIVAIGKGNTISWYSWNGIEFTELGSYYHILLNAVDVHLKNNLIYISDKSFGLKIFDISLDTIVAEFKGTGGWESQFGNTAVTLGNDGKIYLTDFNAGVIIIEPYDLSIINVPAITNNKNNYFSIYPNPTSNNFVVELKNKINLIGAYYQIYDITGREIENKPVKSDVKIEIETANWQKGLYFVTLINENKSIATGRVIVQ
ncbi:MAG: T9SS type A sorting domain-containing protein [Bacteroidota bacterium]